MLIFLAICIGGSVQAQSLGTPGKTLEFKGGIKANQWVILPDTIALGCSDTSRIALRLGEVWVSYKDPGTGCAKWKKYTSGVEGADTLYIFKKPGTDSIFYKYGVAGIEAFAFKDSIGTTYSDAQARAAISLTTTGTSGAATYNSTTGVLNIPQYSVGAAGVTSFNGRTGAVTPQNADYSAFFPSFSGSYANPTWITSLAWSKLTGTPTTLSGYGITDATSNARAALSITTTGTSGPATYNSSTGVLNIPQYSGSSSGNLIVETDGNSGIPIWRTRGDSALILKAIDSTADIVPSKQPDSSIVFNLTNTGVTAGTYGSSTLIPVVQTDAKGRIVSISTVAAAGGGGGGTPGGSDTQVQFNDGGAFGGDAGFTYNKTTNSATLDSLFATRKIQVGTPPLDGFRNSDVSITFDGNSTNGGLVIYNSSGTRIFSILENGGIGFPQIFNNFSQQGLTFIGDNTKVFNANAISGFLTPVWRYTAGTLTGNGSTCFFRMDNTYSNSNTSVANSVHSTLLLDPTINITGINGYRGIRVSPTLTSSGNDAKAFEATNLPSRFVALETGVTTQTGAYTAGETNYTILGNASSAGFTVTLPTAVGKPGRIYVIKKIDSTGNTVTVGTTSSQTIDGSTTYTALSTQYKYVTVQSDGANWVIIGNN